MGKSACMINPCDIVFLYVWKLLISRLCHELSVKIGLYLISKILYCNLLRFVWCIPSNLHGINWPAGWVVWQTTFWFASCKMSFLKVLDQITFLSNAPDLNTSTFFEILVPIDGSYYFVLIRILKFSVPKLGIYVEITKKKPSQIINWVNNYWVW